MPGVLWATLSGIAFGFSQLSNRGVNRQAGALAATTAMVTAMLLALLVTVGVRGEIRLVTTIPPRAAGWFVAATLVHFLGGWTLFALSQQRIGPSRTASVLSINPVVAALMAALVIDQRLRPITWLGVIVVTVGVAIVAVRSPSTVSTPAVGLTAVLAATLLFSISPLFVSFGLARFDGALVGLVVGLAVTVPCMHLSTRAITGEWVRLNRAMLPWLILGGTSAGFAVAAQWTAFDLIPVGAVVSLQQLSTPVVLFVGPVLLSDRLERPDRRVLAGSVLILGGAIVVALFGRALG